MDQEETIQATLEVIPKTWLPCSLKIDGFSLLVNVDFSIFHKIQPKNKIPPAPLKPALKNNNKIVQTNTPTSAISSKPAFQVDPNPKVCKVKTIRTVLLKKRVIGGLGISIKGGKDKNHPDRNIPVVVSKVYKDLAADENESPNRRLFLGDVIYSVDGISLKNVSHEEAVQIFINTEDSIVEFKAQFNYDIYKKLREIQVKNNKKMMKSALSHINEKNKYSFNCGSVVQCSNNLSEKSDITEKSVNSSLSSGSVSSSYSTADILDILQKRFPNMRSQLEPSSNCSSQIVQLLFPLMFASPSHSSQNNTLKIDFQGQTNPDHLTFNLNSSRCNSVLSSYQNSSSKENNNNITDSLDEELIKSIQEIELFDRQRKSQVFFRYLQLSAQVSTSAFSHQIQFNSVPVIEMSWLFHKNLKQNVFCVLTANSFYAFAKVPQQVYTTVFNSEKDIISWDALPDLVAQLSNKDLQFLTKPEFSLNGIFCFNSTTHFYHWLSKLN